MSADVLKLRRVADATPKYTKEAQREARNMLSRPAPLQDKQGSDEKSKEKRRGF
jgi:hypothetical protein